MRVPSVGLDETHPHQEPATGEHPVVVGVPLTGESAMGPTLADGWSPRLFADNNADEGNT